MNRLRSLVVHVFSYVMLLLPPFAGSALLAQGSDASIQQIEFDHSTCLAADAAPCLRSFDLEVSPGEAFEVVVINTDPGAFDYRMVGVVVLEKPDSSDRKTPLPSKTVKMRRHHDARFGGYLVLIERKTDDPDPADKLGNVTLVLTVTEGPDVTYSFGGGFTGSSLTNPVFGVADDTVASFPDQEDAISLGVATMITVHFINVQGKFPMGASFGLGLENSRPSYYLGFTASAGKVADFTFGAVAGSVDALPAGLSIGSMPTDANALNNLQSRTKIGVFVGVSFAFLGGGKEALNKPFLAPTAGTKASN